MNPNGQCKITVRRNNLFADSYQQIMQFKPDLRMKDKLGKDETMMRCSDLHVRSPHRLPSPSPSLSLPPPLPSLTSSLSLLSLSLSLTFTHSHSLSLSYPPLSNLPLLLPLLSLTSPSFSPSFSL